MVCGKSVDEIKQQKKDGTSTPLGELAYVTNIRRKAYKNGLNAGSLQFLAPGVSQEAACDGTRIMTTTSGQEAVPGTLLKF